MISSELNDGSPQATPVLNVSSIEHPFDRGAISELERLLPAYIRTRRWYRAKTRTIENVKIEGIFAVPNGKSYILITRLNYAAGDSDNYVLAINFGAGASGTLPKSSAEVLATFRTASGSYGNVSDALFDAESRNWILEGFTNQVELASGDSRLRFEQTRAFAEV